MNGVWCLDHTKPTTTNEDGVENNLIIVSTSKQYKCQNFATFFMIPLLLAKPNVISSEVGSKLTPKGEVKK